MVRQGASWRFQYRVPRRVTLRCKSDENISAAFTHVRVSVGPMSVRAARLFGMRAVAECERVIARMEGVNAMMGDGSKGRGLSEAMRTTALASMGDAILSGAAEFGRAHNGPPAHVVREIGEACREAVRRMARGPEGARDVQATLTQTVEELRVANVMVEAETFAPDLVDGVARAAIGKLIEALDGDRETLDRVAIGGLTEPSGPLPGIDSDASEAPLLSEARDRYLEHKNGKDRSRWSKDARRACVQIDALINYARDRPVTQYGVADIEDYAQDLKCLPLRADALKDESGSTVLKGKSIREQIEYGRAHPELPRISQGTIANGYTAIVRSAVTWECRRARPRIGDPFEDAHIPKPPKANRRACRPLPIHVLNEAIRRASAKHSLLALLFVLALLGTRRLAVLTYINGAWLERPLTLTPDRPVRTGPPTCGRGPGSTLGQACMCPMVTTGLGMAFSLGHSAPRDGRTAA